MKKLVFEAAVNLLAFYVASLLLPEIKLNGPFAAVLILLINMTFRQIYNQLLRYV